MSWQDDAARSRRMLEHVVGAAMADDPTFAQQSRNDFVAISLRRRHYVRIYLRTKKVKKTAYRPSTRHAISSVPSSNSSATQPGSSGCCSTAVTR